MRRFELCEGSSDKFWEISINGSEVEVRYGRRGTDGQTRTKDHGSPDKAQGEHDKLIAAKMKKGYEEVGGDVEVATAAPQKPVAGKKRPAKKSSAKRSAADKAQAEAEAGSVASSSAAAVSAAFQIPTAAQEDGVHWSDDLRKLVYPRPDGVDCHIAVLPSAKKSWSRVQEAWKKRVKWLDEVQALSGLAERVAAAEPSVSTPDEDANLIVALAYMPSHKVKSCAEVAVDALVATGGCAHTTRAVLLAIERHIANDDEGPTLLCTPKEEDANRWGYSWRSWRHGIIEQLTRLRELLVLASPEERAEARAAAAEVRPEANDRQRLATTFLFPGEQGWFAEDLQQTGLALALASAGDGVVVGDIADRAVDLMQKLSGNFFEVAATMLDGLGAEAAPIICRAWRWGDTSEKRQFSDLLAAIGHDRAVATLLTRSENGAALSQAMQTQPRRLLRHLAPLAAQKKDGEAARKLLVQFLRRFPGVVDEVLPSLAAEEQQAIAKLQAEVGEAVPEASPDAVPALLREPPWTRKRKKSPVADVQMPAIANAMAWHGDERKSWRRKVKISESWAKYWEEKCREDLPSYADGHAFVHTRSEFAEAIAAVVNPTHYGDYLATGLAIHELAAIPLLHNGLQKNAAHMIKLIRPFAVADLAPAVAQAYLRKSSMREDAKAWILRNPAHAANGVMAQALGKAGKARQEGEAVLRLLAHDHREVVLEVAKGAGIETEVEALLAIDPTELVPTRLPKLPEFADAAGLPPPVLNDDKGALPESAVEALLTMLAFSPVDDPYPGLEVVAAACTRASLARFAWALFETWLMAGASSKEIWCMNALGVFGDDECARQLAGYIRKWPGESAHARAVSGLEVLTAIGSDVSLMHLNGIAEKVKFKGLQDKAREKIAALAEAMQLSPEQLADRLAPDLGLDADGSLVLDFGPRQFRVGFDEQLVPYVADMEGGRLKNLPKPNKKDDETRALEAVKRFKALKKDARAVAKLQLLRLELAMCNLRRFEPDAFRTFFVEHPLVFHIVRRVVWAAYRDDTLVATFRVAEDRTYADIEDRPFEIPAGTEVGIPHPLQLPEQVAAKWAQLFGDYEILQPFPQLGRPTFVPVVGEEEATTLGRVDGITVPTSKVLGLLSRGWRKGEPIDGGAVVWVEKALPGGLLACLDFSEGLVPYDNPADQTLKTAAVSRGVPAFWKNSADLVPLGELDPVVFSELVRDLEGLRPS